jgi:NTE family protein
MKLSDIDSLAISGAGTRIVAEVGAMQVLEEKGILNQLKHIGGTSAGSIIAGLYTVGYSVSELKKLCFELDFKQFEDGGVGEKLNILNDYGIHKGKAFLDFLEAKIETKTGSKYTTFAGLKAKGCIDLNVFATCLNTGTIKVFNYIETPGVSVAHAIRCSMSIPLFFEVFMIPHDNNIYVDGGCNFNYPINYFNESSTIGITFNNYESSPDNGLKKGEFKKYMASLLGAITNSQAINLKEDESEFNRSIILNTLNISAINFDLTTEQKNAMFNEGLIACNAFISKMDN